MSCVECVLPGRGLSHPHQSPWTGLPGHGELKPQSTILLQLLVDNTLQQQRGTTLLYCTPKEEEEDTEKERTLHTHAAGCARAKVGKRLQHFVTHLLCYFASLLLQRYTYCTASLLDCCTWPVQCLLCFNATICVFYHSAWARGGCRSLEGGSQN